MTKGYVKCKHCGDMIWEGEPAYYHDGCYYCSSTCLTESCECIIEPDNCKYSEKIEEDVDGYNDDKKLGII